MSDLQRHFARAHLSKLPPAAPEIFDERDEEEDGVTDLPLVSPAISDSSSSASSTGTIVPSPSKNLFERPKSAIAKSSREPLPWNDFFSQELFLPRTDTGKPITHHAYLTPPGVKGPLFVTHHGAGSSGLSFAAFTSDILKLIPNAGVLSLDARGHGSTYLADETSLVDLGLATLSADLAFVVKETQVKLSWPALPDIMLIGHSLGGAVITEVAHKRLLGNAVLGHAVLDVVEGSAMDALQSMETYLMSRPSAFPSIASGIEWHIRSRTIRSAISARVSVPALLVQKPDAPRSWRWRTDLAATKPFWENWFIGLSKKFLEARGGKLLILAGTDRLDKELMIGQMQGKYQLQVFPEAGHFVHEDQPAKTAQVVADFYRRNDRSALVLPPKVGDLLKNKAFPGAVKS